MKHIHLKKEAKNAFYLAIVCFISYLAVYFLRNVLGTVTPQMIEGGNFTTEHIGTLSSVFFICYAIGQFINGIIGDKIKAKYMMSIGMLMGGVFNIAFVFVSESKIATVAAYGLVGFFLSMIYGPMTKVVSENVNLNYAHRCSLGYTFASFFGSPLAGMCAMFLSWSAVFIVGGSALIVIAVLVFGVFCLFEKKGIVTYGKYDKPKEQRGGVKVLFRHQIVKYTLISVITGVVRTSVVFWMPTYLYQYLGYSQEKSALIFSIATVFISLAAFVALFLYELFKKDMDLTVFIQFIASTACFAAVYFVKQPVLNIVLLVLGILLSNSAATILWSYYCPDLRDTGMVSTATGFLDFMSYMAAAIANKVFPGAVDQIGWNGLILVWMALVAFGVLICIPFKWNKAKRQKELVNRR